MAFTIVNNAMLPLNAPAMPGAQRVVIADQTGDLAFTNLGLGAVFKNIRLRIKIKGGFTAGTDSLGLVVRVDNATDGSSPEVVCTVPSYATISLDAWYTFDLTGWSQTGFCGFAVDMTLATSVWDAIVDVW